MSRPKWSGVYPATVLPFNDDFSIDEAGLRKFLRWISCQDGVSGLLVNGYTGEVTSLDRFERRRVVEITTEEVRDIPVVAGIMCEGTLEAITLCKDAKEAGASGCLVMPPQHWLRFGKEPGNAYRHFATIADAVDIDLFVHQYPSTTKACYSTKELLELVEIPNVMAIKYGAREMARYELDYKLIKKHAPRVSFLNCMDEYLLPGLALGGDGVVVGCASFVPDLIVGLVRALERRELTAALEIEEKLFPIVRFVYGMGEPSGTAHQRMKEAMVMMGRLSSPVVRPPLKTFNSEARERLRMELVEIGMLG